MKKLVYKSLLLVILSAFTLLTQVKSQGVGNPAPDFSLKTLAGDTFTLSEQGGKVVFIFLFGNTCPHCIANAPNTESGIYQKFKDNPNFVAVGIDVWDGTTSSVRSFQTRTGVTYDICLDGSRVTSNYSTTYDRILVVDQEGVLQYKATANASSNIVNEAADVIESLLVGSTGIEESKLGNSDLYVYPNPVIDIANVQASFNPGVKVNINLLDMSGRLLINENVQSDQSGNFKISLINYPNGIYYLRASNQRTEQGSKIVISR